jgi:branched-chain amino acid transport system permease protein
LTIFFQLLAVGIMTGAVLGLTAMGFILVYRCSGIFNMAQGELLSNRAFRSAL